MFTKKINTVNNKIESFYQGKRRWFKRLNSLLTLGVVAGFASFMYVTAPPATMAELIAKYEGGVPLTIADERQVFFLAEAGYFEARNQSPEGIEKVLKSILVRVDHELFADSVEAVVRKDEHKRDDCQYSYRCDGEAEAITDYQAWVEIHRVAYNLYSQYLNGSVYLGCAHSYHADYVAGKWHKAALRYDEKVGTHIFYCDKTV